MELLENTSLADAIPVETLRGWIRDRVGLPYRAFPGMDVERWVDYHQSEIERLASRSESSLYLGRDSLMILRPLDWDTGVLGIPVASLDYLIYPDTADVTSTLDGMRPVLQALGTGRGGILITKISSADVTTMSLLGRSGFDLLTIHLDHLFDTEQAAAAAHRAEGYEFREARPDEAEEVGEVSSKNYAVSDRYTVDPLVPRDRVPDVYREWGRNSVNGFADLVWVARRDDRIVGFGTWSIQRTLAEHTGITCAWNGLASVASSERNRGVFRAIASTAMGRMAEMGIPWVSSPTNVLNIPTQRCFRSVGAYNYAPILTWRLDLGRLIGD